MILYYLHEYIINRDFVLFREIITLELIQLIHISVKMYFTKTVEIE